jgi:predicted RNase H-like nuclease (RuvC/YqgF family)
MLSEEFYDYVMKYKERGIYDEGIYNLINRFFSEIKCIEKKMEKLEKENAELRSTLKETKKAFEDIEKRLMRK